MQAPHNRSIESLPTPRLLVRRYTEADLPDFMAFHTHPEVARTMGKPPMKKEAALRYLAEQAAARGDERAMWHGYAIVPHDGGRAVGEVGLYLQARPDDEGDLGYVLHPAYQGQGLATEAARALVRHGFQTLGLRRISAHCDADNAASYRLMERLGMIREATKDEGVAYAIIREAWLALPKNEG